MNDQIKQLIKRNRLYLWEIANNAGVCEMTIVRWMRTPLSEEHEERLMKAIGEAVKQRNGSDT